MTRKCVQAAGGQCFIQAKLLHWQAPASPSAAEIRSGSRTGAAVLHFQDPAPVLLVTLLPGAPPALAWMASCPDRDQDPKAQRGNFPSLSAALFGIKFKLPWNPGTKVTRRSGPDRAAPGTPGDGVARAQGPQYLPDVEARSARCRAHFTIRTVSDEISGGVPT